MNILNYLENFEYLHKQELNFGWSMPNDVICRKPSKPEEEEETNLSEGFNKHVVNLPDGRRVKIEENGDITILKNNVKKASLKLRVFTAAKRTA